MREIKFRAWIYGGQALVYNYFMGYEFYIHEGKLCVVYGLGYFHEKILSDDEYVLEEYTGLKDKNGVEIYEGDVVTDRFGTTWEVKFENGMFMTDYDSLVWLIQDNNPIEVIGNIHQNPELLEE